jgi:hypothetical protein
MGAMATFPGLCEGSSVPRFCRSDPFIRDDVRVPSTRQQWAGCLGGLILSQFLPPGVVVDRQSTAAVLVKHAVCQHEGRKKEVGRTGRHGHLLLSPVADKKPTTENSRLRKPSLVLEPVGNEHLSDKVVPCNNMTPSTCCQLP